MRVRSSLAASAALILGTLTASAVLGSDTTLLNVSYDPTRELYKAIDAAFAADWTVPVRHHHAVPIPGEPEQTLLLMPAWEGGKSVGVKLVTITPGNGARSGSLLVDSVTQPGIRSIAAPSQVGCGGSLSPESGCDSFTS